MDTGKINVENVLLLEQPFLKIPFEQMRKTSKANQRAIDRELSNMSDIIAKRMSSDTPTDQQEALKTVESMLTKMLALKRKVDDSTKTYKTAQHAMRERIAHLDQLYQIASGSSPDSEAAYADWRAIRLARQLTEYFHRQSYEITASMYAEEESIEPLVDAALYDEMRRIDAALAERKVTEALSWCKENATGLKRIKSSLEFELRLQEFVELCRLRQLGQAIQYARKQLAPWQGTYPDEIKQAMALLAFAPDTKCLPYKDLYDLAWWTRIQASFRLAIYTLYGLPPMPTLFLPLHAGMAALKTPACTHSATELRNINCPLCDDEALGGLAKAGKVPFSHHVNSTIVCFISGKVMQDDNVPLCMPNGMIYSSEAMHRMAAESGGTVRCPRTGKEYALHELKKLIVFGTISLDFERSAPFCGTHTADCTQAASLSRWMGRHRNRETSKGQSLCTIANLIRLLISLVFLLRSVFGKVKKQRPEVFLVAHAYRDDRSARLELLSLPSAVHEPLRALLTRQDVANEGHEAPTLRDSGGWYATWQHLGVREKRQECRLAGLGAHSCRLIQAVRHSTDRQLAPSLALLIRGPLCSQTTQGERVYAALSLSSSDAVLSPLLATRSACSVYILSGLNPLVLTSVDLVIRQERLIELLGSLVSTWQLLLRRSALIGTANDPLPASDSNTQKPAVELRRALSDVQTSARYRSD
ncbi:uncharacterized protein L969DRAFT_95136 [Mixia osmundae IAM 14324]|uniref:CTLH domain-containing protein n=1 Tax=Mixia osmundae (strain CBS 9802 / IAM 14324 / JCM 22182 / KY 12970) TaxID=764103 RepID=G7E728_MIXOS|nr:uncharacterized protein L969DRAFT_95136 [Mixia osmundae IAM 14324]KEI38979.1 hypothetical protein L969DRAFT_95136 [Mixia osmundae IAM 14324]GAA98638.1 hypothetical protein E5Q_05325 [Mixia osmundae IAM 14324]